MQDNNEAENNDSVYMKYTVHTKAENGSDEPDEIILVSFKRSKKIHKAGAKFASLLDLTHSQMVDKAEAEFIKNHAMEVPVAFNVGEVIIRPKITPEEQAVINAELIEIKQTLNKQITTINDIVSRQIRCPEGLLEEWRQRLFKKLAKTRTFLKNTKLQDPKLMQLLEEAGKALDDSGKLQAKAASDAREKKQEQWHFTKRMA